MARWMPGRGLGWAAPGPRVGHARGRAPLASFFPYPAGAHRRSGVRRPASGPPPTTASAAGAGSQFAFPETRLGIIPGCVGGGCRMQGQAQLPARKLGGTTAAELERVVGGRAGSGRGAPAIGSGHGAVQACRARHWPSPQGGGHATPATTGGPVQGQGAHLHGAAHPGLGRAADRCGRVGLFRARQVWGRAVQLARGDGRGNGPGSCADGNPDLTPSRPGRLRRARRLG